MQGLSTNNKNRYIFYFVTKMQAVEARLYFTWDYAIEFDSAVK